MFQEGPRRLDTSSNPSSGILRLVLDNQPPDDAHTGACRHVVEAGEEDLMTIDQEIVAAEAHLQRLRKELTHVAECVEMHKRILHSPRKLNADVLSEIFVLACYDDDRTRRTRKDSSDTLDTRGSRWVLGQVCSLWRNIITTQLPRVWTDIDLIISPKHRNLRSYLMDRFLRRSANRKLSVALYISKGHDPHSPSQRLLSQFLHSCDRWQLLHFEAHTAALGTPSMDWHILNGNLPSLKRLSLNLHCPGRIHVDPSLLSAFTAAPNLQSATVNGWNGMPLSHGLQKFKWVSESTMPAPTGVMMRVTFSFRTLPNLLQTFRNLEVCEVDALFGTRTKQRLIHLPLLRSLTLHSIVRPSDEERASTATIGETENLLFMSTFPALTSLTLTGRIWDPNAIIDFLERSKCTLTELDIPFMGNEATRQILSHTPHLTTLIMVNTEPSFLPFLQVDFQENSGLCLSLETLTLVINGLSDGPFNFSATDVEALMTMFTSRRAPLAITNEPNKQANLYTFMLGVDAEVVGEEGMKMLRDGGLQMI